MIRVDEGRVYGRGISFPPRIGPDGRLAWSVGAENIREAIRVILLTELNERLMLPAFGGGLGSFLYEPNTPATHRLIQERISQSLARWEARIDLENVSVVPSRDDAQAAVVTISYRLVATGVTERLGLTVRLTGTET